MGVTLSSATGGAPVAPSPAGPPPGPHRPAGMRTEAPDRSLMARCLAYLFGAGAALALVAFALPNNSNVRETETFIPQAGYVLAAVAVVAILLVNFDRLPLWTFQLTLSSGTALISFVIYVSGDPTSAYTMFYVWIALYAFYFFGLTQAFFQMAFLALAYGAVLHFKDGLTV